MGEKHAFHATELLSGAERSPSVSSIEVHDEEATDFEKNDIRTASYPYFVSVLPKVVASLSLKKSSE